MFNKTIKESTEAFGKEHQCITLYEELSELEQAICKMLRFGWQGDDEQHTNIRNNFIEEIVDVMNLIEWFYSEMIEKQLDENPHESLFDRSINNKQLLKEFLVSINFCKNNLNEIICYGFDDKEVPLDVLDDEEIFLDVLYNELFYIIVSFSESGDSDFINFVTMQKAQEWADYKHERNLKRTEEVMKNRK